VIIEALPPEQQYPALLTDVYNNGAKKQNIQETEDRAVFVRTLRFKSRDGYDFPLTPIRRLPYYRAAGELLWMLRGDTTLAGLHDYGVRWWDNYATPEIQARYNLPEGDLGRVYGAQIRRFNAGSSESIDQLLVVQQSLKEHPEWRRHLITLWNPLDATHVYYAPCLTELKFFSAGNKLSLAVTQRSADVPGGVPFDTFEMGLFLLMMAQATHLQADELVHILEDTHIYNEQLTQVETLMTREIRPLPRVQLQPSTVEFTDIRQFLDLKPEEIFTVENYNPHPTLRIPVSSR